MSHYIKDNIEVMGLSQAEFAKEAGVSKSQLSRLINGGSVGEKVMYRVTIALGGNLESVFIGAGAIPPNWVEAIVRNWGIVMSAIEREGDPSPRGKVRDWSDSAWLVTDVLEKGGRKVREKMKDDGDYQVVMKQYRDRAKALEAAESDVESPIHHRDPKTGEVTVDEALEAFLGETERVSGAERQEKGEKDSGTDTNL